MYSWLGFIDNQKRHKVWVAAEGFWFGPYPDIYPVFHQDFLRVPTKGYPLHSRPEAYTLKLYGPIVRFAFT